MHLKTCNLIKKKDEYYHLALKCLEVGNPTSVSVLFGQLVQEQGFQLQRKMQCAPHGWLDWKTAHSYHQEGRGELGAVQ